MSESEDADLRAENAALRRRLAELEKQAGGSPTTVAGDRIEAGGPVATRGSALADHEGIAVVGSDNVIVKASVYYGAGTTDPAEALRIYRRVLVAGSRYLPLRGVDVGAGDPSAGQKSFSLAHVYIDLDTKTSVPLEEKGKRRRKDAPSLPEEGKIAPAASARSRRSQSTPRPAGRSWLRQVHLRQSPGALPGGPWAGTGRRLAGSPAGLAPAGRRAHRDRAARLCALAGGQNGGRGQGQGSRRSRA